MMDCIYCTPEWLEESGRLYQETPRLQEMMKRLSVSVFFRIYAEPEWGIDADFVFGGTITKGNLSGLRFYSENEVKEKAELVLSTSPQQWKLLLRKEHKFITDFMKGKIKLEKGTIPGVLAVAPYADAFISALTQVNLIFQDEMTAEERMKFREYAAQFRANLGI